MFFIIFYHFLFNINIFTGKIIIKNNKLYFGRVEKLYFFVTSPKTINKKRKKIKIKPLASNK